MIPVILPPSIFRLKAEPATLWEMSSLAGLPRPKRPIEQRGRFFEAICLDYRVDGHQDFLRTNDFTPQQAFGRSFAYRQAPASFYMDLQPVLPENILARSCLFVHNLVLSVSE